MPAPLVSVITPNFNGDRFIRRAVESVRAQEFDLEHFIIDDCSTDNSWSLLSELSKKYRWLRAIPLEKNSGPVVARNRGIELATGRFIAFLDVDDFWLPDKLKTQIGFMLENNCSLSFSDYRFVSEDGFKIGRRLEGPDKVGWHLHHMTRYLGCLTVIIDRSVCPDFSIPDIRPARRAEDFLAWSRWIEKFGPAMRCPRDLARYSVVANSRSAEKKGALSVWRLYRNVEKIPIFMAGFYFFSYLVSAYFKRIRHKPTLPRKSIDSELDWSFFE